MKERGMSWGTLEYNEYFIAKLFFNEYQDILDVYEGEFQQNNVHLTVGSFNVMVATFLLTDQKDKAIQLIKEAQSKWHITPDIRDFERTIRRALPTNKQLVELAKELIVEHGITDTETLNSNLMHLFREKRLDEVKQLLKEYKGHELDVNSYNLLIKGFADARMNREATGYYKEMENKKMKPNAYICTTMLDIYAHARDIQSAEEVVRQTVLGGHAVDEVIYNQLIKVYFKCRQPRKAFLAFEEIQKSKRLQVNEVILNTMVNGLVINKELKVANKIYQQMIQTKFKPDIVTFNTMLKGYADVGDLGSALEVIKDMFRLNQEPDIVTFTTFINSIFDTKTPKSAEDMMNLLYEMGVKPNIYTFNSMINGWIRVNKMSEAEKTLNMMMTDYKELKPTVHTFTNLIQGYIEQMNLNKAMKTFQTLLQHGIEPDRATFNFMIVGFLNFDRLEDAYSCLERMNRMNLSPTKDTWLLLLNYCAKNKDWLIGRKVIDLFDKSGLLCLPNELLLYTFTHFLDLMDLWILLQTSSVLRLFASNVIVTLWKIEITSDNCMKLQCRAALIALETLSNQLPVQNTLHFLNKESDNDKLWMREQVLHNNIIKGISSYKHQFVLIEDIDIRNRIRIAVDVIFHHTVFVSANSRKTNNKMLSTFMVRLLSNLDQSFPSYCHEVTFTLADNIKAFLEYTGYKLMTNSDNKRRLQLTYDSISACFDFIGAAVVNKLLTESHVEYAVGN
ncbi:hypothetical protein RO3G_07951 [Rhizopus delemar RA 99-880]|uniref:Pentacotripeptide-repeat region of PRORP domain-containing protein n=1 Tax=Rhizopus delemar (strain RA 99-880 / ATCC MYA-4621 / FGSC 9543 / NRRL 43880) TaxID=246409 RepID=I1C466_RHIO9|nr:hypothetical protein RO3G_07951 [Rhizopus delemar RA 99-880]|eukprot:EIE83246.1 hypothetical protein RO3G_07951 [Rhizopus delemar RA 99-880]